MQLLMWMKWVHGETSDELFANKVGSDVHSLRLQRDSADLHRWRSYPKVGPVLGQRVEQRTTGDRVFALLRFHPHYRRACPTGRADRPRSRMRFIPSFGSICRNLVLVARRAWQPAINRGPPVRIT